MVEFIDAWLGLYDDPRAGIDATDDRHAGQGLLEYALIIWFVAIVVFASVVFFAGRINALYSRMGSSIPN
jgi:Flp pilus assembly pilin Flp